MMRFRILYLLPVLIAVLMPLPAASLAGAQALPNPALTTAVTRHGGEGVRAIRRIRIEGQSSSPAGTMPVVISADLDGSIRFDYGNPVTRTIVNTTRGSFAFQNSRREIKPPHVGLFAQWDLLSIFGLTRLEGGNVTWTELAPIAVSGRPAVGQKADTGQSKEHYRRTLRDQAEIRFDVETGLVAAITRTHYAENSVDFAMPVTIVFSDHRTVNNLLFPFRIERYLNNATLTEVITVTNVQFNPPFSPSIFER